MEIPTNLVDAARALVATANPPLEVPATGGPGHLTPPDGWTDNPTPAPREGDPEPVDTLSAWTALTPRALGRLLALSESRQEAAGVDLRLPEVVRVALDGRRTEPLVSKPIRAEQRPRFVVAPLDDPAAPSKFLHTPVDAHRVTLGGLTAALAADRLEAWIPSLLAGEARQARPEVEAYRTYATAATARLPDVFDWLAMVPEPAPAFVEVSTVPTVLYGLGRVDS